MNLTEQKQKAETIARNAHKGQFRKSGVPYITHPEAVVRLIESRTDLTYEMQDLAIIAGWLHDVLEDTSTTYDQLALEFDVRVSEAVWILTRKEDQSYLDYVLAAKENKIAHIVKNADLEHNLSDLKSGSLRDKYIMAQWILNQESDCGF